MKAVNEEQEREHLWRNIAPEQFGRHYFRVVLGWKDGPTEKKPGVKLIKVRGEGVKVA